MQLIKKIEINYLRSLYSATIDKVGDLNVFFGRNDSGKSNLLRALNLFFNEEIEHDRWLDFDLDMSDHRKQEAREAKGKQFIWIKITFHVPENYRGAIGDEIAVKRQWNRFDEMTETVFPTLEGAGKQARLTRLLNDIDFSYIPAIKDLNVYADLIERMYGAAAETAELKDATNSFVDAIGEQTTTISEQLTSLFGAPARLAPPTEMRRLFRNLDFAHGDAGHSLLRQKGDGVKARHLPELLRFINQNERRKKLFLWGFEEPENSLDLGAAEGEARRFADFAARDDTQVFITSHSPAFYLSQYDGRTVVRRLFISKQEKNPDDEMIPKNAAAHIDRLEDAEARMEEAGLLQLPFVIRRLGEQREALNAKHAEAERLRTELAALTQPTLFVEGPHDVTLFRAALARVEGGGTVAVKPLGGTPQTTDALLSAVLEQGGVNAAARTMFLFDDDKAGRGAFRKLCKGEPQAVPTPYHKNTLVWALQPTDDFRSFLHRRKIKRDQAFFTAEFLFPSVDAAGLCAELIATGDPDRIREWQSTINGDYWPSLGQVKCSELISAEVGSPDWLYARGVPEFLKGRFIDAASERGLSTAAIDALAEAVSSHLMPLR